MLSSDHTCVKPSNTNVLIIGGGIVGTFLSQALSKHSIASTIFERDETPASRNQGWGMTFHLALPTLSACLPISIQSHLEDALVDEAYPSINFDSFPFINAVTMEIKARIPYLAKGGRRYGRAKLRQLFLTGTKIEWGKRLQSISTTVSSVTAHFTDGTSATGTVLIGADGSNSQVRKFVVPEMYSLSRLPFRDIGVTTRTTKQQLLLLKELDPLMFRATHLESGDSLWWAVLEAHPDGAYTVQLNLSWPLVSPADEVPSSSSKRLAIMKQRCNNFAAPLRDLVASIPEGTEVTEIALADWTPAPRSAWKNFGGRITLAGDAAHAMTMFRGENCNQGMIDAGLLTKALSRVNKGEQELQDAIDSYEDEMRKRTSPGVFASREACFRSHECSKTEESFSGEGIQAKFSGEGTALMSIRSLG